MSQDESAVEAAMATNSASAYNSVTLYQGSLGYEPRDSLENNSLSAVAGATSTKPDYLESSTRVKALAKEAIVQA